jgi:serine/threonine protein kinase
MSENLDTKGAADGRVIGRYRLLQKLGEGGFGTVWQAEQREPVVRRVALKLLHRDMESREIVARFEAERQALALMDHPGIARVFDGGVTESGSPYFVMELVRGAPITDYCDKHRLTTRARLELFIAVCEAVQHAHHKGVVHRDLKPSNVLVTDFEDGHAPKVIDFGIAKAMAGPLTDKTIVTARLQMMGTPEYMAPEQAEPGVDDIDTRADVYSLGVILYELHWHQALRAEECDRRRLFRDPAHDSRGGAPQAVDAGLVAGRVPRCDRRAARGAPRHLDEEITRRSRLDRDAGAREGALAPLLFTQRTRSRSPPPPR